MCGIACTQAESPAVICVNTYDDNPSRTVDLVGHYTLWKICFNLILQLYLTNEDYMFEDIFPLVSYYIFSNMIRRELASSFSDWVRKY
jgi:hypothetical protein